MLQILGVRKEESGRIEKRERESNGERRGGVIKRVMAGGDTVFLALHLLWAHWSRVHWGRGRELGLEPGDRRPELEVGNRAKAGGCEPEDWNRSLVIVVVWGGGVSGHEGRELLCQCWDAEEGQGYRNTAGRVPNR